MSCRWPSCLSKRGSREENGTTTEQQQNNNRSGIEAVRFRSLLLPVPVQVRLAALLLRLPPIPTCPLPHVPASPLPRLHPSSILRGVQLPAAPPHLWRNGNAET